MSGSVTRCLNCGVNVWAGTKICPECGSDNIAPTLREFYNYLLATDPDFRKSVKEQKERERHCPQCDFPIDREGFIKRNGYKQDGDYNCPNCRKRLTEIRITDGSIHIQSYMQ